MPDFSVDSPPLGQQQGWARSYPPSMSSPWVTERVTPADSEPPTWVTEQVREAPPEPPLEQDEPGSVEPDEAEAVNAADAEAAGAPEPEAEAASKTGSGRANGRAYRRVKPTDLGP
jgi:hypothetical protein